ncbi:MAG: lytic transglycosylase domain-containing protein [Christensenellales bacterium]|jgi:soluble lytic murein transglycosylase
MSRRNKKPKVLLIFILIALMLALGIVGYQLAEKYFYKLDYPDEISKYAAEYGQDPYLVASVIYVESKYQVDAVSPKGASGLMQIMPDVGQWIAEKLGEEDDYTESSLFDPATNIRYGCWMLDFLDERYNGNLELMLAGYNAGIGNVQKWQSNPDYSSDGTNLDVIPFPETENYIQRVKDSYAIYKRLYNNL